MLRKSMIIFLAHLFVTCAYASDIRLLGQSSYSRYGGTIKLLTERVDNSGDRNTGMLKIILWATEHRYKGGEMDGYILGESEIGRLPAQQAFVNIAKNVRFFPPRSGRYYLTMTVSEFRGGRYVIVDHANFDHRQSF